VIKYRSKSPEWTTLTPTIFPDGTSQVWKLSVPQNSLVQVLWHFESEVEIFHMLQLAYLVKIGTLYLPYFPYARQDKIADNNTTFAKYPFIHTFTNLVSEIITLDIHSQIYNESSWIKSEKPKHFTEAARNFNPHSLFFPDSGALKRYSNLDGLHIFPKMYGEKVRNQATGEITSYKVYQHKDFLDGERVLIIDDICDGGATFINAAKELKKLGVKDIGLCTSHSIYSKGLQSMRDAGISKFYTTDSFINVLNFKNEQDLTIYSCYEIL
jgi:ribose-phosphate pyrophosphokinase